ncbi:MAG TPA: DUF1080 domain-containing protein [Polyangiaceae bacterium]|nr:DUF1080 domain-containing protein [Polyangiaceae bacterium]
MKHSLKYSSENSRGAIHGRAVRLAWPAAIAALLAVNGSGCSDAPVTQPVNAGGTPSQGTAGAGGSAVTAGTPSMMTGGTPAATSGAAGMPGTSGSASGSASGGTGGSAAGSGGSAAGSGGASGGSAGSGGGGDDGWVQLFNGKNLDGWIPGNASSAFFAAGMHEGEPVIHVYPTQADQSEQGQGSLRTSESYSSYVFHLEYKWGTKRYAGRKTEDRDNGICFHVTAPLGDVWPTSVEFQLGSQAWPGDWVSGNIFMLVNKTRAQWPYVMMNGQQVYSPTGTKKKIGAPTSYELARVPSPNLNMGGGKNDPPATQWNIAELTVNGSKSAEYKVNGTVVNGLTDMEVDTGGGTFAPLDKGPIAIQAEFAEVYFRNIKIKVLP